VHRGQRLNLLLTRVLSLRIIVIVAALSVVALVITLGAWVWIGVTNDQYSQLDRRLDSVSSLGDISILLRTAQNATIDQPVPNGGLVRTARVGPATVSVPSEIVLPQFENGYANTTINGVEYRVRTFSAGVASIAVGAPLAETQHRINDLHQRVLLICGGVIVGTVLVGWVMWLIMINPFRLLAQQARAINAQSNPDEVQVRGVWEAVEIAEDYASKHSLEETFDRVLLPALALVERDVQAGELEAGLRQLIFETLRELTNNLVRMYNLPASATPER